MAVTNYSKKCTSCGGNKWEYKKGQKVWICCYCGSQVERREEYDGLYTIKNVVRQVILDSAYRRLDQADRNLSECQKISAQYAGTLVAGICFRLIAAVSGGINGQDPKALIGQLRRDYQMLTEEGQQMSDDETAVYEFLDSSDAWATLATVFDTLGDQQRREYLLTLADPSQVFSKETNKSLLRFALKNDRQALTEKILANQDNIDIRDALSILLTSCPDSEKKGDMAARLLAAGAVDPGEEAVLEDYLTGSDSVQTKAAVTAAACEAGLQLQVGTLLQQVLGHVELPQLQQLLAALFRRRLYDGEIELLMDFAAAQKDARKTLAVLEAMAASGQFVALSVRQAQGLICNSSFTSDDRRQILDKLCGFTAADRLWETVAGQYLCQSREEPGVRNEMLQILCQHISSVPARDFEQYVLQCTLDGGEKPARIRQLLALPNMNTGFFRELSGNYLRAGKDDSQVRPEVLHQLMECGLPIDGGILMDYICKNDDTPQSKVELIQLAVKNGTMLRADALSQYLEQCAGEFSPQLFALLCTDGATVSPKALENYILICKDAPAVKANNALVLAQRTGISLGASRCSFRHLGHSITGNLAQAYILTTGDDIALAGRMLGAMTGSGTKLTSDIQADGRIMRFHKYLNENKSQLTPVSAQLCQENRLFGFSFF